MYWYRWSPERQQFEFLLFSNSLGKSTYGSNVNQEKFSVRGSSSQSYSLHIGQLHASDAGMYYCSVSQSSELVLGSGTRLGVGEHRPRGAQKCRRWAVMRGCVVVDGLSRFGIQGSGSEGVHNLICEGDKQKMQQIAALQGSSTGRPSAITAVVVL